MKFKTFLEGITKPLINLKVIQKDIQKYHKWVETDVKTKEITKMITKIGKKYAESVGLEFKLEIQKVTDLSGEFVISGAFDEDTLIMYFMYTDNVIFMRNVLWDYLYNDFPGFIKHEVLHFQQFLRRENLDLETFRDLEGGRVNHKKYIDGNLGHKDEIEAYAMNAADEIYRKYGNESINTIKLHLKDAVKVSDAMSDYYKLVRKDKKLWTKFINKVITYIKDME